MERLIESPRGGGGLKVLITSTPYIDIRREMLDLRAIQIDF